jgi:hypothetical protein
MRCSHAVRAEKTGEDAGAKTMCIASICRNTDEDSFKETGDDSRSGLGSKKYHHLACDGRVNDATDVFDSWILDHCTDHCEIDKESKTANIEVR